MFKSEFGNSKKIATQSHFMQLPSRFLQSQKSRLGTRLESPISTKFLIETAFLKILFPSGGAEGIRLVLALLELRRDSLVDNY